MSTSTLTSKGQATVPVAVRRALRLRPGDRVEFVEVTPGRVEIRPANRPVTTLAGSLSAWAGEAKEVVHEWSEEYDDDIAVVVLEDDS